MALPGKQSVLWVLWLCLVLAAPGQSCVVIAPKEVRPGVEETVVISDWDTSRGVTLILQDYPKKEHTIFQRTFGASGAIDVVRIFVDPDKLDPYELRRGQRLYVSLTVVCGQAFTKEAILPVKRRSGYMFLQRDKPIYTPRQTVNLRMIAVGEDLVPTAGEIKLQIKNPKGVVAHETLLSATDNTSATGMFSHSYSFPTSPVLGVWTAVVSYGFRLSQETNITFELKEYVPPSFSAKITTPSVILPDSDVTVTVEAKYPYGKPVQGSVTCKFKTRDTNTGAVRSYPGAESVTEELVHGNATFLLPKRGRWGENLHSMHLFSRLVVEAEVLDKATGERVTAEDDTAVYAQSPYRVSFRRTDPNFRPGGPKVVMADVTYANGQPAAFVPCTVKAETTDGFNVPVHPDVAVTDSRGRVAFTVLTDRQHKQILAEVETLLTSESGRQAVERVLMKAFRSEINAVLFLESADGGKVVKVGGAISIRVGIHPPTSSPAYYIVTRNGLVKQFGQLHQYDQPGSSYRFAQFSVRADMSPSVRVLAYAFHQGHMLADSLAIEVEEACLEKAAIAVETYFESERPGANGSVKVLGSSGTRVGILGINKQVSELASEGLLTSSKMFGKLKSHDMGCGAGGGSTTRDVLTKFGVVVISQQSPDIIHEESSCQSLSRGRSSFRRMERSLQSEYASDPFLGKCCTLGRLQDRKERSCAVRAGIVRRYISGKKGEQCASAYMGCCSRDIGLDRPDFHAGLPGAPPSIGADPSLVPARSPNADIVVSFQKQDLIPALSPQLTSDEEDEYDEADVIFPDSAIRNNFRETWLFDERVIGPDGVADIAASLPHSITTWSVQAVSVAPSGGVCIPQPREVRAFQPFFLQVALPYNVVRKEQIEVLATVYNYVNETIWCKVYVYGVEGVCTGTQEGERSKRRTVSMNASSSSSLTFPVVPLREGRFTIKVHAHCNHSSASTHDVVEKELHVVPEGVPVEKVVAVQINPASASKRPAQKFTTDVYDDSVDPVTNHQIIAIKLIPPPDAVPGTRSCSISFTGSQLGPSAEETLDEIEVLMRRPTGSSEEIDTLMAQTLLALEYLRRRNVTDPALEERGRRYLRDGYQRQLSFWNETGFFSEFENAPSKNVRLTALVTRTLCKARQHISINDSVISSTIQWLERQEESIAFRGYHEMWREVEIRDVLVAHRAFVVVTFVECMPFIEEKLFATKLQAVLYRLRLDTRFLMNTNQQRINGHAVALAVYAVARGHVKEHRFSVALLREALVHDPLQYTLSTAIDKSSKTVEGTSYALLALLTGDTNDTDTIQSLVNWLNIHRPSSGTSPLRHDSAVALQALMEFDFKFSKPDVDLMCNVRMNGQRHFYKSIQIRSDNAAVRQHVDIRDMTGTLVVTANGTGRGLLSVRMKYNVLMPPELLCKFNITVHADVSKPKAKSADTDPFTQELLDELAGIGRERHSAYFASSPNEHHRTTRSSNQPQQSKLVYDIEVCSQYIGVSDSNAAVIEVGLLSGFDPVVKTLDAAIKMNTNLSKYLVTEKKVILHFNRIPRGAATCVQFSTERKHVVHNIQSAAVKVYDYGDPSRSCTQFYGLGLTDPLLKVACTGTKCQCIEAECPRRMPFLNVTRVMPQSAQRQILLEMACREHDFVWIGNVTGNSVLNGFRHIHLRVDKVLKEGSENRQSVLTVEKLFLAPHHCGTAHLGVGEEYFVLGRDGEPFANNGSVGVRYSLDKHVRLFNVHSTPRRGSRRRLNSLFLWLSTELQRHKGCPKHLRVLRSATFSNEQIAVPKRL